MILIYKILLNLTAVSFLEWVSLHSSVWIKYSDDHSLSWTETWQLPFLPGKGSKEWKKKNHVIRNKQQLQSNIASEPQLNFF